MAKEYLKKGDICRTLCSIRTSSKPSVIGGLLMVDEIEGEIAYVHHIPECGIGSFSRLRSRLKKQKTIQLQVSVEDFDWMTKIRPSAFTRKATKKWEAAIKNVYYDVAIFYNAARDMKVVVTGPTFWTPYANHVAVRWTNLYVIR